MKLSGMNPGEALHKLLQKRWLIWLVNSLLVVWLVWLIADAAWQHFLPAPEPEVPVAPPPPPAATPDKLPADQMTDWHLFGVVDEQEKKEVTRMLNAPETKLKLSLKGVVATDNHLDGYAIIQKPDKEELHFKVKDSVFGLATLEEIYIDRVILLRGGRYETLKLPIEFMGGDLFMERQRKEEAKRIVSDFRHKLVNRQGMELMKMFGFDTAYRNGGFAGFTITVMGEDGARMLEALGVEEGDLITAVNGKRFSEGVEAVQSLTKLKDATEVDVEIDRKGVPMFFHFDFADLGQTADIVDADTPGTTGDSTEVATDQPASTPADNPDP
jgi:general secretion pathway protein C